MSVYPLTTPLDLRLSLEIFNLGPLKWGHHHWTVGVVSPTRRRPGMRQHKSSVPHLQPQEKGCGRSVNELMREKCKMHDYIPSICNSYVQAYGPYINCSGIDASVAVVLRPPHEARL
ncbi:hypothetical protein EVAR_44325_1 [Eumeta japonica]|uniref:Uncharacterized protein n=1 Tax=Eumeta variegata TaxID=151549 RepID=A0A4C1X9D0_EUMVA|nr:hypothetical protein EVAR_44325_1 [Eumeta japonica]